MDFCQTFVTGASWDTDDLITFWGQKVKVQGHTIAAEAHSTRRYRQVQLFLKFNAHRSIQVGPLDRSSTLTAQMMRPGGHHNPFYGFVNKKIFSLFCTQKCEKLHYAL